MRRMVLFIALFAAGRTLAAQTSVEAARPPLYFGTAPAIWKPALDGLVDFPRSTRLDELLPPEFAGGPLPEPLRAVALSRLIERGVQPTALSPQAYASALEAGLEDLHAEVAGDVELVERGATDRLPGAALSLQKAAQYKSLLRDQGLIDRSLAQAHGRYRREARQSLKAAMDAVARGFSAAAALADPRPDATVDRSPASARRGAYSSSPARRASTLAPAPKPGEPRPGLEPADRDDLPALVAIERASFTRRDVRYTREDFQHRLAEIRVAREGGRAVSYLHRRVEGGALHILSLATDPEFKGSGYAKALLQEAIAAADANRSVGAVTLEVSVENLPAIGLYERFGFKAEQRLRHYFNDGSDAFLMRRPTVRPAVARTAQP